MVEVTRAEIETVHERISELKQRVTVLETDLPYIRSGVDDIKSSIRWATRTVIGAALVAIVMFAMSGGFVVPV